ncbi:MAG: hypothetical protein UX80_C0003G0055 [Candidatus Amesbacteria bacterium GW2011_GWA2_47_11b]|uniref:Uncharacterized protein n=3 Tax=Candidatus Amesiibacteriota TaxID=1752730 RepID=A0A0G1SL51_9BACT|nr:MAG: hypothetical protein UX42_C0014G0040 [Microgenomates group bacterium GW2011_GWC1_46_20]KKU58400.1 MAG: hypothetical protein UX80_C0003G0055 [Candidatus Amesbacteria bacterium GW2011_GWA2_47_11b]KKU70219.1 MAG: hypothetical protein UX92_C0003G0039 [Candidatus Amesbacteria bacterium GW2011_GWA1_47_20]KKU83248.1 MAG: hypothetical protein UY11_C0024G0007 [Candidatus Amesbacteria bacterium GW2011_GWC2_47_8]
MANCFKDALESMGFSGDSIEALPPTVHSQDAIWFAIDLGLEPVASCDAKFGGSRQDDEGIVLYRHEGDRDGHAEYVCPIKNVLWEIGPYAFIYAILMRPNNNTPPEAPGL